MSAIEWIAVALGLANVGLLIRRSIWNYPFGIAMVSLYGWIFYETKLYSDALLQVFFLALNIYGWVNWRQARDESGIPVRWQSPRAAMATVAGALVAILAWGTLMHRYTDAAYPWWDGAVAMLSVFAQALQARRRIDCWIWWILVDLLAIPLYWVKDLQLTAGLYVVFLLMSATGLASWLSAARTQRRA